MKMPYLKKNAKIFVVFSENFTIGPLLFQEVSIDTIICENADLNKVYIDLTKACYVLVEKEVV